MPADALYTFGGASQTFTDNPLSLGFAFTANENVTVSSLGWFDATGEGFQSPHAVGVFDSQGDLLASATLAPGTSDALQGSFRYAAIAPIMLTSGHSYVLAGTSGGNADSWTVNDYVSGFQTSSEFTVCPNAALYDYTAAFVEPASHYSDYRVYAGPNLIGAAAAAQTPEPATMAFVALALIGMFAIYKKKRTVQASVRL